jgi:hypothetical protein
MILSAPVLGSRRVDSQRTPNTDWKSMLLCLARKRHSRLRPWTYRIRAGANFARLRWPGSVSYFRFRVPQNLAHMDSNHGQQPLLSLIDCQVYSINSGSVNTGVMIRVICFQRRTQSIASVLPLPTTQRSLAQRMAPMILSVTRRSAVINFLS